MVDRLTDINRRHKSLIQRDRFVAVKVQIFIGNNAFKQLARVFALKSRRVPFVFFGNRRLHDGSSYIVVTAPTSVVGGDSNSDVSLERQ